MHAAGTCLLVVSELSEDSRRRQQAPPSSPALSSQDGPLATRLRDLLPALGFRPTPAALAWGAATAAAAAAAVAACNAALAAALSADPTAEGNTQALRAVLQAASAAEGSGGGGGAAAAAASAAAVWTLACLVLSECLLAPLAEEVLFRGVLLRSLLGTPGTPSPSPLRNSLYTPEGPDPDGGDAASRSSRAGAAGWLGPLLGQAAVFATYHLNAAEWPAQFALGLALGGGYLLSGGNLAASLVAHGLYNGAAVLLLLVVGGDS
ncbi:hypothetical protein PLESTM_000507700 [Pleodorina starrii]|nr:hypothetical protein PLESTM_000507700 [Pleodorina starrii]